MLNLPDGTAPTRQDELDHADQECIHLSIHPSSLKDFGHERRELMICRSSADHLWPERCAPARKKGAKHMNGTERDSPSIARFTVSRGCLCGGCPEPYRAALRLNITMRRTLRDRRSFLGV